MGILSSSSGPFAGHHSTWGFEFYLLDLHGDFELNLNCRTFAKHVGILNVNIILLGFDFLKGALCDIIQHGFCSQL